MGVSKSNTLWSIARFWLDSYAVGPRIDGGEVESNESDYRLCGVLGGAIPCMLTRNHARVNGFGQRPAYVESHAARAEDCCFGNRPRIWTIAVRYPVSAGVMSANIR